MKLIILLSLVGTTCLAGQFSKKDLDYLKDKSSSMQQRHNTALEKMLHDPSVTKEQVDYYVDNCTEEEVLQFYKDNPELFE